MKQLLILLVLLIFCPKAYTQNTTPTTVELGQAEDILFEGMKSDDPKKIEKIELVVQYLIYEASIGNQTASIAATSFLSNYKDDLKISQRLAIRKAQAEITSSYIKAKSLDFNSELFIEKGKELFSETQNFRIYIGKINPTADQVAAIWFKYIMSNFDAFTFMAHQEPGINRMIADKMLEDNGLFAYLLNKTEVLSNAISKEPDNETKKGLIELKKAYFTSLLVLNDIVISDAKNHGGFLYKDFELPRICEELKVLRIKEERNEDASFRFNDFRKAVEGKIFKSTGF